MPDRFHCISCKAPIRWARHEVTERSMPLDREPSAEGNILLVDNEGTRFRVLAGMEIAIAQEGTDPLYRSHFASCPFAQSHRSAA